MNVAVIGTGYVGLVVGACLAEAGNSVVCADVDESKIKDLKSNRIPIYERGLTPLVVENQAAGRLEFTNDVGEMPKELRISCSASCRLGVSRSSPLMCKSLTV